MRLTILSGPQSGQTADLTQELVLGRDGDCDVVLDDVKASRRHARLAVAPDGSVSVEDLGSTNGTYVDGVRIATPTTLSRHGRFQIGDTMLAVGDGAKPGGRPTTLDTPKSNDATPSRIERLALTRTARRTQVIAAVAGGLVLVAILVGALFATGVLGGEDETPTVAEVIDAAAPSVVQVRTVAGATSQGGSSGWVYDAEAGLIVTRAQIVASGSQFAVRVGNQQRERSAALVAVAPCEALAVLRVSDTAGLKTMPLGSQADLAQGDEVVVLGYPDVASAADRLSATAGVVSIVRSTPTETVVDVPPLEDIVQTDAPANPGDYGGPLVTRDGELVGVNLFQTPKGDVEGQFFAIGVDRVREVVPALVDGASAGWLGIGLFAPSAGQLEPLGLPEEPGLLITNVVPGTPAAEAGLAAPALLVAIDGAPIDGTLRSYCAAAGNGKRGASATLSVIPAGSTEPVDVQVGFS